MDPIDNQAVAQAGQMTEQLERMNRLGQQFARTMSRAFQDVALKGRSFGDVLRGLAQQLAKLALRAAFKPLEQGLGNLLSGGLGGLGGSGGLGGGLMPFAKGGVVAAPTYFPLAGGQTGLMGERGAEAILPLARGPDGRLGVQASGGRDGGRAVTVNITTPDVDGFRRSQTQVAAMLSRTVALGQRNL